jgi:DNA-binding CsgD family transcriptional regulator
MDTTDGQVDALNAVVKPHHRAHALTDRQRDVLRLIAEGRSMKQAAAELELSPRTVAFHKYRMMKLLQFRTSAELLRFAIRLGLVA